jgi:hypothetical protein
VCAEARAAAPVEGRQSEDQVSGQRGGPIIRKCPTCRQKVFVVEHDEVEPIGAARIVKSDLRRGETRVQCVCGAFETWTRQQPAPVVR